MGRSTCFQNLKATEHFNLSAFWSGSGCDSVQVGEALNYIDMSATPEKVEFWFDPACPWCWMTSRWITEVSEKRQFAVQWQLFSLEMLNEGREPGSHAAAHAQGLQALRVCAAVREAHGDAAVGQLYTELGTRYHKEGNKDMQAVIANALAALQLPAELAAAAADTAYDAAVRSSTEAALKLVGNQVGIPIVAIDGKGFFGPVVTPAPTGQQALDLFDGLVLCTQVDGFYELKKTRNASPQF